MKVYAFAALTALMTLPAHANDFEPALRGYFESQIAPWLNNPAVIESIRRQNAETAGYSQQQIDALDLQWRAEVGTGNQPTIDPVLGNSTADFLREQVAESGGVIAEIFLMDMRGLNVAASAPTSDYWQGDEAKFTKTYGAGAGAVFVDEVEFDESAQTYLGQVSAVIVDPDTNEPIGAVTIGLDAEALF